MDELIPIVSKLQDVLGALGQNTSLDLPQIVVVGGQSSGKSSVLEAIVGRSFLPRGHGIVTRRPLILQLYNTNQLYGSNDNDGKDGRHNDDDDDHDDDHDDDDHDDDDDDDDEFKEPLNRFPEEGANHNFREWGEFLHRPGHKFGRFDDIREEIVHETDRLTGRNRGIHASPIHLKIFSPHVLALTLVDLPGMAKVAVGDQPEDIEMQIRDMSMRYISNPNAIILAVSAANADLANSDALQLAQAVDPYGNRTVGVLTKLDLMDPGTDALDMLTNKVIPLRRGYVGVVNRGQRDVRADLSIRDGLKKEEAFFRSHPVYSHHFVSMAFPHHNSSSGSAGFAAMMSAGGTSSSSSLNHHHHPASSSSSSSPCKLGTKCLTKILNTLLMHHIRDCLPELKNRIQFMMMDVQNELDALGTPMPRMTGPEGAAARAAMSGVLLNLLSKFASNFANLVEGRSATTGASGSGSSSSYQRQLENAAAGIVGGGFGAAAGAPGFVRMGSGGGGGAYASAAAAAAGGHNNANANTAELFGGARISYIFTEIFSRSLSAVGPYDGLSEEEIRTTISNANGTRPSALFVPEVSFDILVKRQIARLEEPGLQCCDLVYEELQRIASQSEPSELQRFPVLRDRVVNVVGALLKRCVQPTQLMVSNLVKIELAYINTNHPDFIGGSKAVARLMEKMMSGGGGDFPATTPGRPSLPGPGVGATPLSSSSLSNYYNNPTTPAGGDIDEDDDDDDDNNNNKDGNGNSALAAAGATTATTTTTAAGAVAAAVPPGAAAPGSYDTSGGGLMSFIFRGGSGGGSNSNVVANSANANAPVPSSTAAAAAASSSTALARPNSNPSFPHSQQPHPAFYGAGAGGGGGLVRSTSHNSSNNNYHHHHHHNGNHGPYFSSNAHMMMGGGGGGGGPPAVVHLPQVPDSMRPHTRDAPLTERERVEMEIIKSLLESYFNIVRKNFIDLVPKTIMYFLVNHVRDALHNELVSELYQRGGSGGSSSNNNKGATSKGGASGGGDMDHDLITLLSEAEDIASRRQTCMEMSDLLHKALEIVNEVRDFNAFQ